MMSSFYQIRLGQQDHDGHGDGGSDIGVIVETKPKTKTASTTTDACTTPPPTLCTLSAGTVDRQSTGIKPA